MHAKPHESTYTGTKGVCMYVCMYGCMDVWMYGCMDVWMYGCMDVWMDGWMDAWMDGWMDGWMDVCVYVLHVCRSFSFPGI